MSSIKITDSVGETVEMAQSLTDELVDITVIPVKTKEELLKERIVDLEVALVRAKIPKGHCPYRYQKISQLKWEDIDCHNVDCDDCQNTFYENLKKDIVEKVSKL